MKKLEHVNGQQAAIDAVLGRVTQRKEVIVAVGPPGAGTSWVLDRCTDAWEASGGAALLARGESFASDRLLFPWLTLALPGAKRLARIEFLKASLAQGTRAVPVVGSVTSYLVEEALDHRRRSLAREALLVTTQEQDLLFVIQAAAQHKRLLLAIDHLDTWDDGSWSLLALVLSSKLDELYPCLAGALIMVGASGEVPTRLRTLAPNNELTEFHVRLVERSEMPLALSTFEFPRLPEPDLDLLYAVTNGRLDLLHDVGQQLREGDLRALSSGWGEFYSGLVQRRLRALTTQTQSLENLLTAAAIIGQTFTVSDVHCLTGSALDQLSAALRLATGEHFLASLGDTARFESAELHRYFHRAGSDNHGKYHAKFAECLRAMRPGDYGDRAHHLLLASDSDNALTCHALAVLAARREQRPAPDPGELRKESNWTSIQNYLESMLAAYNACDGRRIDDGFRILEGVETFLPEVLIAERDYLEAHLLLLQRSINSYEHASTLLERWQKLSDREAEVWSRIAQLLIVAQVMTDRVDDARRLEETLTSSYWDRRHVDPSALYGLNVLRRRAECLHHLPTATQRLESALTYFGPISPEVVPRHPIQYYYTLTNLTGNLIAGGRFDTAYSRASELEQLVRNHPNVPWPALEIAANNVVLARYVSGQLDPSDAANLTDQLVKGLPESGDRMLLQNNHAVFLALAGMTTEARGILESAHAELMSDKEPDEYHRYFVGSNLAVLLALANETTRAEELLQEHQSVLKSFYPAIRATMLKRHPLVLRAFSEAGHLSPKEFDRFLLEHHALQLGPQWAFYGRGFLLSDIQFWSAD